MFLLLLGLLARLSQREPEHLKQDIHDQDRRDHVGKVDRPCEAEGWTGEGEWDHDEDREQERDNPTDVITLLNVPASLISS